MYFVLPNPSLEWFVWVACESSGYKIQTLNLFYKSLISSQILQHNPNFPSVSVSNWYQNSNPSSSSYSFTLFILFLKNYKKKELEKTERKREIKQKKKNQRKKNLTKRKKIKKGWEKKQRERERRNSTAIINFQFPMLTRALPEFINHQFHSPINNIALFAPPNPMTTVDRAHQLLPRLIAPSLSSSFPSDLTIVQIPAIPSRWHQIHFFLINWTPWRSCCPNPRSYLAISSIS